MAEGSAAERTTGGKEAGGIPGVRQAAVARMASTEPAFRGLRAGTYAGPGGYKAKGGGNYTRNFSHGSTNLRTPRYHPGLPRSRNLKVSQSVRPAVNYNNVGPARTVTT